MKHAARTSNEFILLFLSFEIIEHFAAAPFSALAAQHNSKVILVGVTNRTQFSEYFKELVRHCAALEKAEARGD